jgi:hypothetical protein
MTLRLLGLACLFSSFSLPISCGPQLPPQDAGIRVVAEESLTGMALTNYPVPNVEYQGVSQTYVPGGVNIISGFTGGGGFADNPGVVTSVDWSVDFIFTFVIPQCGEKTQTGYVPPQGATFYEVCIL